VSARYTRHVRRPPDLTSLFDVLFIVVFAVLIRGAAVQQEAEAMRPKPPQPGPPPPPPDLAALRERALAAVAASVAERQPLVARVTSAGKQVGLELADRDVALDVPLLEHSPDPDVALAYLGDRSADLRLCRIAALHLGVPDLAAFLVIVTPDAPHADLRRALHEGLRRDTERCLADQRGIAVMIDAAAAVPPEENK
jgi:hypothetical protein